MERERPAKPIVFERRGSSRGNTARSGWVYGRVPRPGSNRRRFPKLGKSTLTGVNPKAGEGDIPGARSIWQLENAISGGGRRSLAPRWFLI
jgi:hypothetical protein